MAANGGAGRGLLYTAAMKITDAATVFQVEDLERSLRYYREVLGFELDFEFGPYAGIHRDEMYLHLCAHDTWKRPPGGGMATVFCDEVDLYHDEVKGRGATIPLAPTDEPYGMRDFVLSDPDGNLLTFGCELAKK
jgi:catechol 2,3-dioxygenase-like lactoylglutathione lyase family enzyme